MTQSLWKKARLVLLASAAAVLIPLSTAVAAPSNTVGIWNDSSAEDAQGVLKGVNPNAPKGGTLHAGAIGTFDNFNPFAPRGMTAAYMGLTYETLATSVGKDELLMRGTLAETFDVAADHKSMVVKLQPQAKFSDGVPVTARDVVFTLERLKTESAPIYRNYYLQVTKAEALDAQTVRFTFATADNRELPLIVSQMPVLPEHWWKDKKLSDPQPQAMPGGGPYKVGDFKIGSRLTLVRDPQWWGANLDVNKGRYNYDRIVIEYYRDATVMREAFFSGDIDFYTETTIKDWKLGYDVPAVKDGRIVKAEVPLHRMVGMTGIFLNTRRPALSDVRVRQALTEMFNFDRLNRTMFFDSYLRCESFFTGSSFAATDPMSDAERAVLTKLPGINAADYETLPKLEASRKAGQDDGLPRQTIRHALTLLKAAGWNLKDGKLLNAQNEPLKLTIMMYSPTWERVYSNWARDLQRIGITLEMQVLDTSQFMSRLRNYDFDLVMGVVPQSLNPGNEQRYFWTTKAADEVGSRNFAGIKMPAIDELVEKLIAAPTKADLQVDAKVLDRILRNGYYVVPGWYSSTGRVAWWQGRITPPNANWEKDGRLDLFSWYAKPAAKP